MVFPPSVSGVVDSDLSQMSVLGYSLGEVVDASGESVSHYDPSYPLTLGEGVVTQRFREWLELVFRGANSEMGAFRVNFRSGGVQHQLSLVRPFGSGASRNPSNLMRLAGYCDRERFSRGLALKEDGDLFVGPWLKGNGSWIEFPSATLDYLEALSSFNNLDEILRDSSRWLGPKWGASFRDLSR